MKRVFLKFILIFFLHSFTVVAQDHNQLKHKEKSLKTSTVKDNNNRPEAGMLKEVEKTVADLKVEAAQSNKPKPVKRGRTRKNIVRVGREDFR